MRVLSRDLAKHSGERVMVEGWLHKKRLLGGPYISQCSRSGWPDADGRERQG